MKKLIPIKLALYGNITLLSLFVIFHLLVIFELIPNNIVWGGKFENHDNFLGFELISISVLILGIMLLIIKAISCKIELLVKISKTGFWIFSIIFLLNTLGNLAAETDFERNVFSPVTFILFLFFLRLAIEKRNNK